MNSFLNKPFSTLASVFLCLSMAFLTGCSEQETKDALNDSEQAVGDAAEDVAKEASDLMKSGKKMAQDAMESGKELAGKLSEQAQTFLNPLKEKFGDLDGLKESPEKLKTAVAELIENIDSKASNLQLPEPVANALTAIKEKLVALGSYLEGQYEQSQVDEKVADILESVKSKLGMSGD